MQVYFFPYLSRLFIRLQKTVQVDETAAEDFHLLLAQILYDSPDHALVEVPVMIERLLPFVRQCDMDDTLVLLAALPQDITFLLQAVHICGQCAHGHRELMRDRRHILRFIHPDRLNDMHIIVRNIAELFRDDRCSLPLHHIVKEV